MSKKLVGKEKQTKKKKNRSKGNRLDELNIVNRSEVEKLIEGGFDGAIGLSPVGEDGKGISEQILRGIWNNAPNMIHEDQYVPMFCILCGEVMESVHDTHNPAPFTDRCYAKEALETEIKNRCCSRCDEEKVIPARLNLIMNDPKEFIAKVSMG